MDPEYFRMVRACAFVAAFSREYEAHYSASNEADPRLREEDAYGKVDQDRCDLFADAAEDAALRVSGPVGDGPDSERGGA